MIGRLQGVLQEKSPPQILLEVGGVGYEVDVPMSTFYQLPGLGAPVTLLTHFVVREDAQLLFGFLTPPERETFRALIKISGVGPKMAMALLSGLSVEELAQAVAQQDIARFTKVPGIGRKTAERLLLELKGKVSTSLPSRSGAPLGEQSDILQALLALGYNEKEATSTLRGLPPGSSVSEGIRWALKSLSG
jgi:Holliday junction DNA helicase RuvA